MLVLPLEVFRKAAVCTCLVFFKAFPAFFGSSDGRREPSSTLFGVLVACFPSAIFLKMLALTAFVVVAVLFKVGFADPHLASRMRWGFDGCLPLA